MGALNGIVTEAKQKKRAREGAPAAAPDAAVDGDAVTPGSKKRKAVAPAPAPPPAGRAAEPPAVRSAPDGADGETDGAGCEVFVKYLPRDTDEAEVASLFAHCGTLAKEPVLLRDYATGAPKGAGWVTFTTPQAAQRAVKATGLAVRGRHLEVSLATFRRERPGLKGQLQAPGTHTPALLNEVLRSLVSPDPGGIFVDATFGRGGHTRAMLAALTPSGQMHAFDMDPLAVAVGTELTAADKRFTIHGCPFSRMAKELAPLKGTVSGILFDLGISSPQLDDPSRGMRPEADGPLDLRFDTAQGTPAWRLLETCSREELYSILRANGDGQDGASARRVADAVALHLHTAGCAPKSTSELAALVAAARCGGDYQPMHAAKLTFQALRMHINGERRQMERGLSAAFKLLRPGGRMGIITWKHSEAAAVMDFVRSKELAPQAFPLRAWWEADGTRPALTRKAGVRRGDALRPSQEELRTNARSRSAVLHVLHKEEGVRVSTVEKAVYAELGWEPLGTRDAGEGSE